MEFVALAFCCLCVAIGEPREVVVTVLGLLFHRVWRDVIAANNQLPSVCVCVCVRERDTVRPCRDARNIGW